MRSLALTISLALAAAGCASQTGTAQWQSVIARAADPVPLGDPQWLQQLSQRTGLALRQVQGIGDRLVVLEVQCVADDPDCKRALATLRDSGAFTMVQPDGVKRLNPPPRNAV